MTRQLEEYKQRTVQTAETRAQGVVRGVLDPLYRYYMEQNQGYQQDGYPTYAYFMGLSQIMLEGLSDLARQVVSTCENKSQPYFSANRWKEGLYHLQECKSILKNQLNTALQGVNDIDTLDQTMVQFLSQNVSNGQSIYSKIFLTDEASQELELYQQLQNEIAQFPRNIRSSNPAQQAAIVQMQGDLQEDLQQSELRLRLIQSIRENMVTYLPRFFNSI